MSISGMTLAVQDVICMEGESLSCGSGKMMEGYVSPFDATAVARLRGAVASVVRMDKIGSHKAMLWLDTGGEARHAAALCGCVGLKPSYGRVSRHGVMPYASSMDQAGPVAETVGDVADLLQVMAGHDPLDGTCADVPVPDYRAALGGGLKGLRVGVLKGALPDEAGKAVEVCKKAGAEIVEVSLPHAEYAVAVHTIIAAAEAATNLGRFDGVRYGHRTSENVDSVADLFAKSRGEGLDAELKQRIILGTWVVSKECYERYFVQAQKVRTLIRRDFEEAFKVCDVMMTTLAPPMLMSASLAGICGLSMPCGKAGVQVLGPAFGEELVLRAAYAYEQEVRA